jgi:hypothetical protein
MILEAGLTQSASDPDCIAFPGGCDHRHPIAQEVRAEQGENGVGNRHRRLLAAPLSPPDHILPMQPRGDFPTDDPTTCSDTDVQQKTLAMSPGVRHPVVIASVG